ncbi:hypothetical protein SpCBS45565_g03536 [Spizellomyces sp. 'palustris']|nr:hypothetical protein SpCBS45565_g03536 [Spizellomyces sp. 'palustris']
MTRDKRKKRKDHSAKKAAAKSYRSQKQAEKAERKNARHNAKFEDDDEDIDLILKQFEAEEKKKYEVTEEISAEPPSPRANASFVASPLSQPVLYLFGGEHYDGNKLRVFNELYKYRIDKQEWRKIVSAYAPGPRSGHQTVALNNGKLLVFAGEFASSTQSQFHHWKDCWTFDLKETKWEKLDIPTPPPRSGHRMTVWKNFVIMFGVGRPSVGFYDNYKTTKYYDDLWIFDCNEYKWEKVELPALSSKPTARSGFQFFTHGDICFLYGGYCKTQVDGEREQGVVHSDMWILHMSTDISALRWERVKKSGTPPPARAGCTMTVHKNRAILFGGVEDDEEAGDISVCRNDMFSFALEGKKWFPFTLKKPKEAEGGKRRRRATTQTGEEDVEQGEGEDGIPADGQASEENVPHPRYNAMLTVYRNTLYLYGGLFEERKKEFTLDDMWTLNSDKGGPWETVIKGGWERGKDAQGAKDGKAGENSSGEDSDGDSGGSDSD